jgi:hypothetical protein
MRDSTSYADPGLKMRDTFALATVFDSEVGLAAPLSGFTHPPFSSDAWQPWAVTRHAAAIDWRICMRDVCLLNISYAGNEDILSRTLAVTPSYSYLTHSW